MYIAVLLAVHATEQSIAVFWFWLWLASPNLTSVVLAWLSRTSKVLSAAMLLAAFLNVGSFVIAASYGWDKQFPTNGYLVAFCPFAQFPLLAIFWLLARIIHWATKPAESPEPSTEGSPQI